jgi:hypothetical protein
MRTALWMRGRRTPLAFLSHRKAIHDCAKPKRVLSVPEHLQAHTLFKEAMRGWLIGALMRLAHNA